MFIKTKKINFLKLEYILEYFNGENFKPDESF